MTAIYVSYMLQYITRTSKHSGDSIVKWLKHQTGDLVVASSSPGRHDVE